MSNTPPSSANNSNARTSNGNAKDNTQSVLAPRNGSNNGNDNDTVIDITINNITGNLQITPIMPSSPRMEVIEINTTPTKKSSAKKKYGNSNSNNNGVVQIKRDPGKDTAITMMECDDDDSDVEGHAHPRVAGGKLSKGDEPDGEGGRGGDGAVGGGRGWYDKIAMATITILSPAN